MIQPQTNHLLQNVDELSEYVLEVNNLSRSKEKKNKVLREIEKILEQTIEYKSEIKASEAPCKCANRILSVECTLRCWKLELKMWLNLRNKEWESAWDSMVKAQKWAQNAVRADDLGEKLEMDSYYHRLIAVEKVLFPKQVFSSASLEIESSICSICEQEYSKCTHIEGRAYNGEMCFTIWDELGGFDHVALVEDPDDKTLRLGSLE